MSVLLNAGNEYLDATLGTGPLESEWRLSACWAKTSEAQGSTSNIFHLADSTGLVYSAARLNATPTFSARSAQGGAASTITSVAFATGTWILVGVLTGPNNPAGGIVHKQYVGGTTTRVTTMAGSTDAGRELDRLRLSAAIDNAASRFRGYIAEKSVWAPANEAEADAIMADLLTYTADTIASGTPLWYRPLLSDANTGGVGTGDLTPTGIPTYHSGDHPAVTDNVPDTAPVVETIDTVVSANSVTVSGTITSTPTPTASVSLTTGYGPTAATIGGASPNFTFTHTFTDVANGTYTPSATANNTGGLSPTVSDSAITLLVLVGSGSVTLPA
jgi:hypothetical protein